MTIDLRQWDQHQHDKRINPDGSIAVDAGELLDLKTRLQQAQREKEADDGMATD